MNLYYESELCHHGIKGMHWGIRRYQNYDGSYTKAGVQRYGSASSKKEKRIKAVDYKDGPSYTSASIFPPVFPKEDKALDRYMKRADKRLIGNRQKDKALDKMLDYVDYRNKEALASAYHAMKRIELIKNTKIKDLREWYSEYSPKNDDEVKRMRDEDLAWETNHLKRRERAAKRFDEVFNQLRTVDLSTIHYGTDFLKMMDDAFKDDPYKY